MYVSTKLLKYKNVFEEFIQKLQYYQKFSGQGTNQKLSTDGWYCQMPASLQIESTENASREYYNALKKAVEEEEQLSSENEINEIAENAANKEITDLNQTVTDSAKVVEAKTKKPSKRRRRRKTKKQSTMSELKEELSTSEKGASSQELLNDGKGTETCDLSLKQQETAKSDDSTKTTNESKGSVYKLKRVFGKSEILPPTDDAIRQRLLLKQLLSQLQQDPSLLSKMQFFDTIKYPDGSETLKLTSCKDLMERNWSDVPIDKQSKGNNL